MGAVLEHDALGSGRQKECSVILPLIYDLCMCYLMVQQKWCLVHASCCVESEGALMFSPESVSHRCRNLLTFRWCWLNEIHHHMFKRVLSEVGVLPVETLTGLPTLCVAQVMQA